MYGNNGKEIFFRLFYFTWKQLVEIFKRNAIVTSRIRRVNIWYLFKDKQQADKNHYFKLLKIANISFTIKRRRTPEPLYKHTWKFKIENGYTVISVISSNRHDI